MIIAFICVPLDFISQWLQVDCVNYITGHFLHLSKPHPYNILHDKDMNYFDHILQIQLHGNSRLNAVIGW